MRGGGGGARRRPGPSRGGRWLAKEHNMAPPARGRAARPSGLGERPVRSVGQTWGGGGGVSRTALTGPGPAQRRGRGPADTTWGGGHPLTLRGARTARPPSGRAAGRRMGLGAAALGPPFCEGGGRRAGGPRVYIAGGTPPRDPSSQVSVFLHF